MTQLITPPTYALRARMQGAIHWICPYSGHLNMSAITPQHYRLVCSLGECNRRFVPGIVFWPMVPGRRKLPPDWVIPLGRDDPGYQSGGGLREAFPFGDLAIVPWRVHQPTHVLVNPGDPIGYDARIFARNVLRAAGNGVPSDFLASDVSSTASRLARLGGAFLQLADYAGLIDGSMAGFE